MTKTRRTMLTNANKEETMTDATYTIENPHGLNGRAWERTYETQAAAAEAVRQAYGWDDIVLSDSFTDDDGDAVACYASQSDCDADGDGSRAPWIIEHAAQSDSRDSKRHAHYLNCPALTGGRCFCEG